MREKPKGWRIFLVFISIFYAVGFGLLGFGLWSAYRSTQVASWPTAPGIVQSCEVQRHSNSDGADTYQVKVNYTYSIGDKAYTGDRLAYGYASTSGGDGGQQILRTLKNAKSIQVRYDPTDPANSALSYGVHRSIRFILAFAITWLAFVVGFSLIWWVASQNDDVLLKNLVVK